MTLHLIHTADERTWSRNKKNLILGEWCLKNSRKHIWQKIDYEMCNIILNNKKDRNSSVDEVFYLSKIFLPKLTKLLNKYHNTSYSERCWEILIGHWLIRFIGTISNRYYTLKNALDNYDISSITFLSSNNYKLATLDTLSSIYSTNCEIWNNIVFLKIFNFFQRKNIKSKFVKISELYFIYEQFNKTKLNAKQSIKYNLLKLCSKLTNNNDAVIHGSYLSIFEEIKLNLFFNQVPFQCIENKYDIDFNYNRVDLKVFYDDGEISLLQFLNSIIYSAIPTVYLENFSKLQSIVFDLNWPKSPKFIFTSNSFDTNELFKSWLINKVHESVPYFAGQHGNNYGQHMFEGTSSWPERSTSDRFITWGWNDGCENIIKAFNFKKPIKNLNKYGNGGILLITTCVMFRYFPWDVVNEYRENINEQYEFLNNLEKYIFNNVTVRLHHSSLVENNIEYFNEKENLKRRYPTLNIEDGLVGLQTLVNKNKLCVFSYDGTGILEFLNSDIPFIAFWPNMTDHIIDDNKILNLYNEFYDVGIFLKSGKDAAEFLNKNWKQIQIWWNSKEVISAKNKFKNYLSVYQKSKHNALGQIFKDELNHF